MKNIFLISLLLLSFTPSFTQDVSFTAKGPKQVSVGEQFSIVFEINDRVKDFQPPQFNDFIFLGSQKGINTVNWKTTQQFVFYFKAPQTGTFTVSPAKAKHDGDIIESNELTIEVIKGSAQPTTGQQQGNTASSPGVNEKSASGKDMFVSLVMDKKSAYVGEQIIGYIKIYTKVNLSGIGDFKGPEFTGFYVQHLKTPPLRSLEPEQVGDETYYSGVVHKVILVPQKSGKLEISPFDIVVQHDKKVKVGYFTTYQTQNTTLQSKAVNVSVKPLPDGKPRAFSGAIGDFDITANVNATEVKANDAIVFKVTVKGKGSIKLIDKVDYEFSPTFEVFDPVVKSKVSENGMSGSKEFEITVIPRHSGEFVVNPFQLVYFNPLTGKYITKKSKSFIINVEKVEEDSTQVIVSNLSRSEVELLESDIRYIKTNTKLKSKNAYLIESAGFYLAILFIALLFSVALFLRREQIKRNANIAKTRHRKASKIAGKRLKLAQKQLSENNLEAFYEELTKALWGYISDKLNIPFSAMSAEQAQEQLILRGVSEETVNSLQELINECEFARYAPSAGNFKPDEILERANEIVSKIEQNF
jgi:hypothetical protein